MVSGTPASNAYSQSRLLTKKHFFTMNHEYPETRGTQFLHHGASRQQEPGIYVSFAENREAFLRNMKRSRMDFERLEKQNLFRFLDFVTVKEGAIDNALNTVILY
ncbi:hypothetical protein E6H17_00135 [Candidatus Bathyarchaeota archaeon]|nr:MAG: hypothetical protein E6H17_00135 [Candidatus Bathyarchaeota archaeon]